MHPHVLTQPSHVSLEWLNRVLRGNGALVSGSATGFEIVEADSTNASNVRLTVTYADDAAGTLPKKMFLKMCSSENSSTGEAFGDPEPLYYSRDYVDLIDGPVATTYDVQHCPQLLR